jgi:hypothetical protein
MITMNYQPIVLCNSRNAPGVDDQPRLQLSDWRMHLVGQHTHLVGFLPNGFTCRVTTPIATVLSASRLVQTSSGRLYELDGPPAHDPLALAVIRARLHQLFGNIDADVTMNYWGAMQAAMS